MDLIELLKAVVIGIIEGITEWLPISSTGHMILADEFIQLNVSQEFWEVFLVVIQLGAILAVFFLFHKKLNPFAPSKSKEERKRTWVLWLKVVVASIPAACIGLLLDDFFTENFHNAITVAIALIVYGIAFIVVERVKGRQVTHESLPRPHESLGKHSPEAIEARAAEQGEAKLYSALQPTQTEAPAKTKNQSIDEITDVDQLEFKRAFFIGLFQALAIVPGTSRSGATILGARILGVSRSAAAEFSFFLAIPIMFGWSLLKVVKAFVLDSVTVTTTEWGVFVVGIIVAFVVSILAIKFLLGYIRNHSFEVFGWYRIALGVVVLTFFAVTGQLFIAQ
ncbi:MAG: undecaprenyl-diphosphate phosphatase [Coriobacteriia bacterium]|nr:undecaprenyl-diphosphate phosphatase [Coriobacteriia bacterium]